MRQQMTSGEPDGVIAYIGACTERCADRAPTDSSGSGGANTGAGDARGGTETGNLSDAGTLECQAASFRKSR